MSEQFPVIPNGHALFSLLLTVLALYLFTRKRIPLEISSLMLLVVLALSFSLFPYVQHGETFEAIAFFEGFGHEALITVCALMVVGQGLVQTGALEPIGRVLTSAWTRAPFLSFLMALIVSAVLSAFINNTPIVVLFLPILISVCLRTKSPASRVLMPMGFATLVGGMGTTIGTSTNLLVVSVAREMGLSEIGMFDFVLPAAIASSVAIVYLWLIAPRLLDARQVGIEDSSPRLFQASLQLNENSPAVGKTVAEAKALASDGITLIRLKRGDHFIVLLPDALLQAGDRLRVRDTSAKIRAAADALKATLYSGDQEVDDEHPLNAENQTLAEIAVVAGSRLDRTNLRYTAFLERHQLVVLGLHRAGKDIWKASEEIMDVTLEQGDVLLVQGSKDDFRTLKRDPEFLVLDSSIEVPSTEKASIAQVTLLAVVVSAATGVLPIAVSSLAGAMFVPFARSAPRCISWWWQVLRLGRR